MIKQNVNLKANIAKFAWAVIKVKQLARQINLYKLVGRWGLIAFLFMSGWLACASPIIWWTITGSLFAVVGLLTLRELYIAQRK